MTDIGVNKSGYYQEIILGKEIGKFGKEREDKENALNLAKVNKGSEIIYQDKDGNWTANEVKEKDIQVNFDKLSKAGISSLAFVEDVDDTSTKLEIARNPNTPVKILKELAKDSEPTVRAAVARNPNAPVELLKEFAKDEFFYVRAAVARNPYTPVELFKELANDIDFYVRAAVARNPYTPVELLKELAKDKHPSVIEAVAGNTGNCF